MAVEMYLKFEEPDNPGESKVKGFEGWIQIFSFSLGASNPSNIGTGTGAGAGKVSFSSLSIQKEVDSSTATLFLNCAKGTHFQKATLVVREAGGESPVDFLTYELKLVYVDSISWGGASGGGKPSESVSLSCAEIKMIYWAQDEKGGKTGKKEGGWNIQTNAAVA